jgi:hypothetical protein
MPSPKLCKAGQQLREQIDDAFPDRDRRSDGWIGDPRHAARKSDHNPTVAGIVRALDIDADFRSHKATAFDLADQLRLLARSDKRIKYIIFAGKIASKKSLWRFIKYRGINPHHSHIHFSFTKKGDKDGTFFKAPLIGG